jgi:NAD(P)-dependent dehydrogenase (short-subunit alcohol dehydrogenase family)
MKRAANEIAVAEPRVDVLINNAGIISDKRQLTRDGFELTFATNHLSYFVLTHMLRERLLASAPARIVNTSSDAHRRASVDFDDLQSAKQYGGFGVYSRSKLLNILFTRELARQLEGTGVTANCFHPGVVNTRLGDDGKSAVLLLFRVAKKFVLTPEKGAETLVFLASSKAAANISGEYFYKCRPKLPNREGQDDAAARRLWLETAQLAGIDR